MKTAFAFADLVRYNEIITTTNIDNAIVWLLPIFLIVITVICNVFNAPIFTLAFRNKCLAGMHRLAHYVDVDIVKITSLGPNALK